MEIQGNDCAPGGTTGYKISQSVQEPSASQTRDLSNHLAAAHSGTALFAIISVPYDSFLLNSDRDMMPQATPHYGSLETLHSAFTLELLNSALINPWASTLLPLQAAALHRQVPARGRHPSRQPAVAPTPQLWPCVQSGCEMPRTPPSSWLRPPQGSDLPPSWIFLQARISTKNHLRDKLDSTQGSGV